MWSAVPLWAAVVATPLPPPGPACTAGVPVANQSGLLPDCPGQLEVRHAYRTDFKASTAFLPR